MKTRQFRILDTTGFQSEWLDQPQPLPTTELKRKKEGTTHDPAAASLIIFPFFSPKVRVKNPPSCLTMRSLNQGCPPNL